MRKLQVEELEPRLLLSGAHFSSQPPPSQPATAGTFTARDTGHSSFVDRGSDHAGVAGSSRTEEGNHPQGVKVAATEGYQGGGREKPGAWDPASREPEASSSHVPASTGSEAIPLGPPEAISSTEPNPAAEAGRGTLSELVNLQPSLRLEYLAGGPGLPAQVPNLPLAWSAVREVPVPNPPDSPSSRFPPRTTTPPATGPEGTQPEQGPEVRSPQLPGVLLGLAPLDLSGLERAMELFLEELAQMGRGLTGHGGDTGLCLWIVAAVTAATACEIARRQLRGNPESPATQPPAPRGARCGRWRRPSDATGRFAG
jgi:hypothetical protein